jgi:hypothetical protein
MHKKLTYTFLLTGMICQGTWAQTAKKESQPKSNVIQNSVVIDSVKKQETIREITEKVIETTYKNYPQQAGQPTIIINNIILPPDYNKPSQPAVAAPQEPVKIAAGKDDEDYQAWLRERKYQQEILKMNSEASSADPGRSFTPQDKKKHTFQQTFGERPARNSGTWVIPMVGVQASGFKADFKNDNATGRTGWNAGVDVRIRTKRFFFQPGVHYFNSSLQITDKDSLTHTKFFDGPRIHSLKVPFMLGVYLTKANSGFFKVNVKGGIVGNYLLAVDKNTQAEFTKDNLKDYSYGLNAGIGLEFGLIVLDVSHEWGITKFYQDNNQKNNILRITLGIKI